jgi:flagellar biosynthesis protein FliR
MEHFLHWNFDSPMVSSGSLGWSFFIGLAFLVVAPIFSGDRLTRSLRYTFAATGGFALFGTVGHFLNSVPLTSIYLLGFTLSGIALTIFSAKLFKRLAAQAEPVAARG